MTDQYLAAPVIGGRAVWPDTCGSCGTPVTALVRQLEEELSAEMRQNKVDRQRIAAVVEQLGNDNSRLSVDNRRLRQELDQARRRIATAGKELEQILHWPVTNAAVERVRAYLAGERSQPYRKEATGRGEEA